MKWLRPILVLLVPAIFCALPAAAQQAGDLDGPMTENPGYNHPPQKPAKKLIAPPIQNPADNDLPNTPLPQENREKKVFGRSSEDSSGETPAPSGIPESTAPPRSDNESSSESDRPDLSPPAGDERAHPNGTAVAGELLHQHEWNPLRCLKDVEVATFYYKQENYKGALLRLRDALEYKPHDAVATFRLAQTLEKMKQNDEARERYEEYLSILKNGPFAAEANKALARLDAQEKTTSPAANLPAGSKP